MANLDALKENDIYTMLLYAMYKMTGDPKYSLISELMYALDRKSFMKLCAVFGGTTIKIPTVNEVQIYIKALIVHMCIKEGHNLSESLKIAEVDAANKSEVLSVYKSVVEAINQYETKQNA